MIEVQDLVKKYHLGGTEVYALNHVSFVLKAGSMTAITGASGSGKSTLMNILGCLDRPDAGRYLLAGEEISQLSKNRLAELRNRQIGFVFQSFNLLPRLTALENVELPLLYAGQSKPRQRALEALQAVNLIDRMHHDPTQLSGGQRQRVAIARALVTNPTLILADEPTGNLDSKTSVEIMALFQQLHQRGCTIVIVTHEADIAAYCPQQIQMQDGEILYWKKA